MRNIQINMEGSQILGFKAELREPTLSTALFLYFSYTSQQMHLLFKPLSAGFSATVIQLRAYWLIHNIKGWSE